MYNEIANKKVMYSNSFSKLNLEFSIEKNTCPRRPASWLVPSPGLQLAVDRSCLRKPVQKQASWIAPYGA